MTKYDPLNKSYQFILLQNKAYHEDNLMNMKSQLKTRSKDYSRVLNPAIPSKKRYLEAERHRNIGIENSKLVNKIQSIIYDKNNEISGKYRHSLSFIPVGEKETLQNPMFHPFSCQDSRRSLNRVARRKEIERINLDNMQLLDRLRSSKPMIPTEIEAKSRSKKQEELHRHVRIYDRSNRPKSVIKVHDRSKLNPVIDQFIQRHDTGELNRSSRLNNSFTAGVSGSRNQRSDNSNLSSSLLTINKEGSGKNRIKSAIGYSRPIVGDNSIPVTSISQVGVMPAPPKGSNDQKIYRKARNLSMGPQANEIYGNFLLDDLKKNFEQDSANSNHETNLNKLILIGDNISDHNVSKSPKSPEKELIDNLDRDWDSHVKLLERSYLDKQSSKRLNRSLL